MNKIKKTTHWMIVMKGEHLKDGIPISEESLENALYAFTRKITYAIDGGGVIDMSDVKGILPNYLKESDHLPSGVSPTYENCKNFFECVLVPYAKKVFTIFVCRRYPGR